MSTVSGTGSGTSGTSSFGSTYSSNRLTGLFSSLDTDSIVESLTSAQQTRIDKTNQTQTREGWLEEAWKSVQDTINSFQNTYTSVTGLSSMLKTSTYYNYKVTSDSTGNAVSLSASSATATGDYSVQVDRLAQNASISSANISPKGTTEISARNTAKLSELKFANSLTFVGGNISFSINNKTFTFSSDTTLQNMINTVNSDTTANVTMKYSRLTNGFTITADSGGADSRVIIKNLKGNAFGSNSAFGIGEGAVTGTGTFINSTNISRGIDPAAALSDLSLLKDLIFDGSGNISFSINGESFSFAKTTTLQDMLSSINSNVAADVTMSYNAASKGFTIKSDSGGTVTIANTSGNVFGTDSAFGIGVGTSTGDTVSSTQVSGIDTSAALADLSFAKKLAFDSSNNISFSINGKTFTFANTTTLHDMLETVNNDATAKVTLQYNSLTDGFMLTSNGLDDGSITVRNISGNAFGANSAFGIAEATTKQGNDAVAVINGTTVTKDTNEFTVDDVTYKLNSVTKGTSDEVINFAVDRDYSSTTTAIKTFVDGFNTMIKTLTGLADEKDYSADYPPLTEAQKSNMTDEQIAAWEKKAQSGLLRNNPKLISFISELKNAFYSSLGGTGKNATTIGIATASYFDSESGQLVLDTNALEKALENDADQVVKMFTNGSSTSPASQQGLIYKLKRVVSNYTATLKTSIAASETKIKSYESDISELKDKLDDMAERYYKKFSAMETALSKLNTQASYISQMFASK